MRTVAGLAVRRLTQETGHKLIRWGKGPGGARVGWQPGTSQAPPIRAGRASEGPGASAGGSLICSQLCSDSWRPTCSRPLGTRQPEPGRKKTGFDGVGTLCCRSGLPVRRGARAPGDCPSSHTRGRLSQSRRVAAKPTGSLGRAGDADHPPPGPGPPRGSRTACGVVRAGGGV